jgi:CubicO group peptidase (beta-lactamase class C family)
MTLFGATMRFTNLVLLLVLIFSSNFSNSEPLSLEPSLNEAELEVWFDGWLNNVIASNDLAGIVVTVVRDEDVLFSKGYGYADVGAGTKLTPSHLIRPGSVSKLFTWTAVMQLVESGRLNLDTDIRPLLDFDLELEYDAPVTIRDLMTHRAGFENVVRDLIVTAPSVISNEDWLKQNIPNQIFPPGETAAYSNYGAALAGYVVERITGQPFEDYVDSSIFQPLDYRGASFRNGIDQTNSELVVKSYSLASEPEKPYEMIPPSPSGALRISAKDIGKFMLVHLNEGKWNEKVLLQPHTVELMHNSLVENISSLPAMALGFYRADRNGIPVLAHFGDTMYHHSGLFLLPSQDVGIFVSISGSGKNDAGYELRKAILNSFVDRYFPCTDACDIDLNMFEKEQSLTHANQISGNYLYSRLGATTLLSIANIFQQLTIKSLPGGELETPFYRKSSGVPWTWKEVSPYVWQQIGGQERLAAVVNDDGKVVNLSLSHIAPFSSLIPVTLFQKSSLHLTLFAVSLLSILGSILNFAMEKYIAFRHSVLIKRSVEYDGSRKACVLALVSIFAWFYVFSLISTMSLGNIWVRSAQVLTLGSAIALIYTWNYMKYRLLYSVNLSQKIRAMWLFSSHAYLSALPFWTGLMSWEIRY